MYPRAPHAQEFDEARRAINLIFQTKLSRAFFVFRVGEFIGVGHGEQPGDWWGQVGTFHYPTRTWKNIRLEGDNRPGPAKRGGFSLTASPFGLVLFGGICNISHKTLNDVWLLKGVDGSQALTWVPIEYVKPEEDHGAAQPVGGQGTVLNFFDNRLYLLGGCGIDSKPSPDARVIYMLDFRRTAGPIPGKQGYKWLRAGGLDKDCLWFHQSDLRPVTRDGGVICLRLAPGDSMSTADVVKVQLFPCEQPTTMYYFVKDCGIVLQTLTVAVPVEQVADSVFQPVLPM